jgi:hypothetical protein
MLMARTSEEAHLYIALHPCDCGRTAYDPHSLNFEPRHWLEERDGELVAVYEGECRGCGTTRRFEFVLDRNMPGPSPSFGAGQSQIIDAGEFLWAAAEQVGWIPVDLALLPADRWSLAIQDTRLGLAMVEEAVKFLPPGSDELPEWTVVAERGRSLRRAWPDRFSREGLLGQVESYRSTLRDLEYFDPTRRGGPRA